MVIHRTIVALVCCSCSVWAQEKSGLQKEHFLGPVHTVRIERITVSGNSRDSAPLSEETFDTHGDMTQSLSYRHDGSITQKLQWGYTYDNQGRILETRYFNANGELTNTGVYTYPSDHHRVDLVQVNPDGSINHKAVFLNDQNENRVGEMRAYPQRGTFYAVTQYDNNGHATERREYNEAQVLTLRSVFKNDKYGNRLSWTVFKADGITIEMSNRTVECDAKGNVIRFADLNQDGSVKRKATISYEFDDHGNWTRKETNWRPEGGRTDVEIIDRTITYFRSP